jgi:Domain of unknown function (DUF4180)
MVPDFYETNSRMIRCSPPDQFRALSVRGKAEMTLDSAGFFAACATGRVKCMHAISVCGRLNGLLASAWPMLLILLRELQNKLSDLSLGCSSTAGSRMVSMSDGAKLVLLEEGGVRFVQGPEGQPLMRTVEDAVMVLEACFSNSAEAALLYAPNLTPGFFDLSSGEAGAILQKLRTYRVRLAVVCPAKSVRPSRRFEEMATEEAAGHQFGLFESSSAAAEWLTRSPG